MATLTGVNGSVTLPTGPGPISTTNIHIFEWNADFNREVFEDSNFDDTTNWKDKVGGMYHVTGTCTGTQVSGVAITMGTAAGGPADTNAIPVAGFVLQTEAGKTYTFAGMISNINHAVRKTDRIIYSISFESSGEVS